MLFAAHGGTGVLITSCMCALNPIKLAWHQIKDYVRSHNTIWDVMLISLEDLVQKGTRE